MSGFLGWLASPARVAAFVIRIVTLIALIVPPAAAVYYRAPGLLLFSLVISLPMWMLLALVVHGPVRMIHEPTSVSVWLWRHVTAWWARPIDNQGREMP